MSGRFWNRRRILVSVGSLGGLTLLAASLLPALQAQQIHRNPFEAANSTSWIKGNADVPFTVKQHTRTNKASHDGQHSELIEIEAKQGSYIHYYYPVGKAPISQELSLGVWVKANRPNIQIMVRVVLPNERDPKSLDDRVTTILRGDVYRLAGRWQRLELNQPAVLAQREQQLMQAQKKKAINFKDAYIDLVILNVYGGPGENTVWIDDLEIGPIEGDNAAANIQPKEAGIGKPVSGNKQTVRPVATVEFSGSQLLVGGKRFFIRGIRHSDTPLQVLRNAGFNTVWVPYTSSPALLREASDLGFWLVPSIPVTQKNNFLVSQNALGQEIARFPEADNVLLWDLGTSLASEQTGTLAKSVQMVKAADPGRPITADVWDGFSPYSRNLNLMGMHRWPLMTGLELTSYREWLEQRRLLSNPGTFTWTWVQTHTPEFFTQLLYNQSASKSFDTPIGPQPAQIQLLTYTALGAGCRGIGFWSDRFLADSHQGRDRLLCLGLINKELEMIEPLLVTMDGPPSWIKTSEKEVQAAVFRTAKGILVLPMWLGKGAQYVPGQSATNKLSIVVPQVPPGTMAWEVTPGEVRGLRTERVVGGTKVFLPEFDLTTAIVFTPDTSLIVRFQEHSRAIRQLAAQWTYEQAVQEIQKVVQVQQQLEKQGAAIPQAADLLNQAQQKLQTAKLHWDTRNFSESYREAKRALRPARILMRAQWEKATKGLDDPVAIPYAVSYFTLPKHWQMVHEIRGMSPGANVLPDGDFEGPPGQGPSAWYPLEVASLDEVTQKVLRVGKEAGSSVAAKNGKLCAMLAIAPKNNIKIGALERTYMAVNSPTVKLPPGTLVQISAWIHIPQRIQASVDGVLFFDSTAGEPLAIRRTEPTEWKKFSIYRRVPESGNINVTLALSGIGAAYFDDVRIEPLVAGAQENAGQ